MRPLFLHRRRYPAAPRQAERPVALTTGCTGDCYQGRECDCATDLPPPPLSRAEAALLVMVWTVSASLAIALIGSVLAALREVA